MGDKNRGKLVTIDSDSDDDSIQFLGAASPGGSVFDNLADQVREKKRQQQQKIDKMHTKRDVEKAHSQYLQSTYNSPGERDAGYSARYWAQRNGINTDRPGRSRSPRQSAASSSAAKAAASQARTTMMKVDSYKTSQCPVMNCEVQFNSKGMFDQHMLQMQHSPCHPYNHLINRELTKRMTSHLCPQCGETYRDYATCREHMDKSGHDAVCKPVPIVAYLCPTCLKLYPEKQQCRIHMQDEEHNIYKYPFEDDLTAGAAEPIPFTETVCRRFISVCLEVDWHVECLDCGRKLIRTKEDRVHHKLTNHSLMSMSTETMAEAFQKLLDWKYTCVQCLRLFLRIEPQKLGDIHECGGKLLGMYLELDCKTLSEYIRRLEITLNGSSRSIEGQQHHQPPGKSISSTIPRSLQKLEIDTGSSTELKMSSAPGSSSYSSYSALLSAASPTTLPQGPDHMDNLTFDQLRRLSGSSGGSNHGDGNHGNRGDASPEANRNHSSNVAQAGGSSSSSYNTASDGGAPSSGAVKTQEDLDMEYAIRLSRQLNDVTETHAPPDAEQIAKDHALALALAEEDEAGDPSPVIEVMDSPDVRRRDTNDDARMTSPLVSSTDVRKKDANDNVRKTSPPESTSDARRKKNNEDVRKTSPPERSRDARRKDANDNVKETSLPESSPGADVQPGTKRKSEQPEKERRKRSRWDSSTEREAPHGGARPKRHLADKVWRERPEELPGATTRFISPLPAPEHPRKKGSSKKRYNSESGSSPDNRNTSPGENVPLRSLLGTSPADTDQPSTSHVSGSGGASRSRPVPSAAVGAPPSGSEHAAGHPRFTSPPLLRGPGIPSQGFGGGSAGSGFNQPPSATRFDRPPPAISGYRDPPPHTHRPSYYNRPPGRRDRGPPRRNRHGYNNHRPRDDPGPSAEPDDAEPAGDPPGVGEMKQIVFLDVDNWRNFFPRLPGPLPDKTFVWGFYGGATTWTEPRGCRAFTDAKLKGQFHLHPRCGQTKDAADFALCMTVGRMDVILPPSVAFTVLSGDRGFCEVERQMKSSARRAVVINPHHKDAVEVFTLIKSVGDA